MLSRLVTLPLCPIVGTSAANYWNKVSNTYESSLQALTNPGQVRHLSQMSCLAWNIDFELDGRIE